MLTLHDAPRDEVRELRAVPGAPSDAEQRGAPADRSEFATGGTDPVLAELEAALAMRLAGADAKALRRLLRRIEELLDETPWPAAGHPLERKYRSYSTEASDAPVVGFRGVRRLFSWQRAGNEAECLRDIPDGIMPL
jgi:hypothetical protein